MLMLEKLRKYGNVYICAVESWNGYILQLGRHKIRVKSEFPYFLNPLEGLARLLIPVTSCCLVDDQQDITE